MLVVWCSVIALGARPNDLSHAATFDTGVAQSIPAALFNILPFWLYNVFARNRLRTDASQVPQLRAARAGLIVAAVLLYSVNSLCHLAMWRDFFVLPRVDAQFGLGYVLVWFFSLFVLFLGYGVGVVTSRATSQFQR
jgi:hypothetical protein